MLPSTLIKLILPFYSEKISNNIKVPVVVFLGILGFVLTSFANMSLAVSLIGICILSVSVGVGDITYL